jgi:ABC-type nitrate/sulfonate/bicarbonate transport system substrate-binding protein
MQTIAPKMPTALHVITFPGGANLPLWVAETKRFCAQHEVSVQATPATESIRLVKELVEGAQDIALCAFDNVVAYCEGQGEIAFDTPPDLFAFMGFSRGTLRLVVNPEIQSYADLRGKTLAVDAKGTGYSLVLRKLLEVGGLGENDYTLEAVGGTAARAQGLIEHRFAGTMLTTPLDIVPESLGFRRLANVADALGPYQTIVGVARRSWAAANHAPLIGFIRAHVAALNWLSDPENRAEAIGIYSDHLPHMSLNLVARHVDALVDEPEGLIPDGRLDAAGIATVLAIRSELGRPQKTCDDPARYIDESYYATACSKRAAP